MAKIPKPVIELQTPSTSLEGTGQGGKDSEGSKARMLAKVKRFFDQSSSSSSSDEESARKGKRRKLEATERSADNRPGAQNPFRLHQQSMTSNTTGGRALMGAGPSAATTPPDNSQRFIIANENEDWAFATQADFANPENGFILPLINHAWQRGMPIEPFTLNPNVGERYLDWTTFEEKLEMHLLLKGPVSQWQKALYAASALGKVITELVLEKHWMAKAPIEGVRHFDLLMKKIRKYFEQFSNIDAAHDNLMTAQQGPNEPITDFHNRVLRMAELCNLSHKNILVRNALSRGLRDAGLREFMTFNRLSTKELIAAGVQRECRAQAEKSKKRAAAATGQVMAISAETAGTSKQKAARTAKGKAGGSAQRSRPNKGEQPPKATTSAQASASEASSAGGRGRTPYKFIPGPCKQCGEKHQDGKPCFGIDKTCHKCGVFGHLARVCPQNRAKSVNEVTSENSNNDSNFQEEE